jgi:hypothetical protein
MQCPFGPTSRPAELPSNGIRRQGCQIAIVSRGHNSHVRALAVLFREQEAVPVEPSQPRRVGEKQGRFAAQHRDRVRVPSERVTFHRCVGELRAVRGKGHTVFLMAIVSELNGLTVGKHLYIDLIGTEEPSITPEKRNHPAVRR